MSESLRFELLAIDRATAPLQAVQNKIAQTTAVANKSAGAFAKFDKKFAMGGLQQAGYQIGDFAVQVANGTNKMQAFGQQAPQLLQIFGPIGAIVGAAVAVFAAFAVAVQKSSSSSSAAVEAYTRSIVSLEEATKKTKEALENANFGGSIVANAENEISKLKSQVAAIQASIESARNIIETETTSGAAVDAAIMQKDAAQIELETSKANLKVIEDKLQVLLAYEEAQRMLNGGLSVSAGIQKAVVFEKERELRLIKEILNGYISTNDENFKIVSDSVQLHKEIGIAAKEQERFNQRVKDGYALYANLRMQAQGLADDAATAATQNLEYFRLGNLNKGAMGRAGAPGQGLKTDYGLPDKPPSTGDKPPSTGGGRATDPLKTLREQLALEEQLLGKSEAQQRVIQALGVDWAKYGDATFNSLVEQINGMDELNKAAERQAEIASTIRSAFSDAFMSIVDGTKSVASAFKDMVKTIIMKLYEQLVVQQMVNAAMGVFGNIFPSLAPAIAGTRAMGGPVTGGKPYLVGESGPEIVVPSRNGQVVPNSQIASGSVTVTQNISFGAGVSRAEIQAMLPKIVESTKAAVFDAQRRSVRGMGYA